MRSPHRFSPVGRSARIAMLLVAALAWTGAPLRADGVPNPLFAVAGLVKAAVSVPFQVVGAVGKGVSSAASKVTNKDAPKN